MFGIAVYYSVSLTVIHQLDDTLRIRAETVYLNSRHSTITANLVVDLTRLDLPADLYVQVWGRGNILIDASQNIGIIKTPLDAVGIHSITPIFRDVNSTARVYEY